MTEQEMTGTTGENEGANYEYLQYHGKIINKTPFAMTFDQTASELSWGKWMTPPQTVNKGAEFTFAAQGRAHSASGTKGTIVWLINMSEGKPTPTYASVNLHFSQPYSGSADEEISVDAPFVAGVKVISAGNSRSVQFTIMEA